MRFLIVALRTWRPAEFKKWFKQTILLFTQSVAWVYDQPFLKPAKAALLSIKSTNPHKSHPRWERAERNLGSLVPESALPSHSCPPWFWKSNQPHLEIGKVLALE
jgi:hypothetical protein